MKRPCTRCVNGWLVHPTHPWAAACPNCRGPHEHTEYLIRHPGGTTSTSRVPPTGSQTVVPAPDWFRHAAAELKARNGSRSGLIRTVADELGATA